jgi:hypothetical protein
VVERLRILACGRRNYLPKSLEGGHPFQEGAETFIKGNATANLDISLLAGIQWYVNVFKPAHLIL